jgi:hypothetical protein
MVCIYLASVVGVAVMGTSIHTPSLIPISKAQNIIHHFTPPV